MELDLSFGLGSGSGFDFDSGFDSGFGKVGRRRLWSLDEKRASAWRRDLDLWE